MLPSIPLLISLVLAVLSPVTAQTLSIKKLENNDQQFGSSIDSSHKDHIWQTTSQPQAAASRTGQITSRTSNLFSKDNRDTFFQLNNENWKTADPLGFMTKITSDPGFHRGFVQSKMDFVDYYVFRITNRKHRGSTCSIYQGKCGNMPSIDELVEVFKGQRDDYREHARTVLFSLYAIEAWVIMSHSIQSAVDDSIETLTLGGLCEQLFEDFMHYDKHTHKGACVFMAVAAAVAAAAFGEFVAMQFVYPFAFAVLPSTSLPLEYSGMEMYGFMVFSGAIGAALGAPNRLRTVEGSDFSMIMDLPAGVGTSKAPGVLIVPSNNAVFRTEIVKNLCGGQNYRPDKEKNIKACHKHANNFMEAVGVGIKQSSDALAIGTTPGMAWESGQPSPFFSFLKPFRDFGFISAIENQMQHPERLFNKIQGQVKSALVAQIYADQQCSVRCVGDRDKKHPARCGDPGTWCPADSPGTLCMASCYNGVKEDNKKLFNYDKATSDPWNLDLDSAIPAAWKMWQSGSPVRFQPGHIAINAFAAENIKPVPILPVCYSAYSRLAVFRKDDDKNVPCQCGDMYGSQSEEFWASGQWYETPKLGRWVHNCRHKLDRLRSEHIGAYAISQCRLYFGLIRPMANGEGPYSAYAAHLQWCVTALQLKAKHGDDHDAIDAAVCRLGHPYDHNFGLKHHEDFGAIMDDIEDTCKAKLRAYWQNA